MTQKTTLSEAREKEEELVHNLLESLSIIERDALDSEEFVIEKIYLLSNEKEYKDNKMSQRTKEFNLHIKLRDAFSYVNNEEEVEEEYPQPSLDDYQEYAKMLQEKRESNHKASYKPNDTQLASSLHKFFSGGN